jgi:hypothetical protein
VDQVNVPVDLRARARLSSDCNPISASYMHCLLEGNSSGLVELGCRRRSLETASQGYGRENSTD